MKLSILIPVFNEKNTIEKTIKEVLSVNLSLLGIEKEIIVIDDGSTDGTRQILKTNYRNQMLESDKNQIKVIFHEENQGKGSAIRTGFANATGDVLIVQDADLEYDPKEYVNLLIPILDRRASVVYGSRMMSIKKNPCLYKRYYWGNKVMNFITNILFHSNLTDSYTCYKVVEKKILKNIKFRARGFEIEAEITAKLLKNGYKIIEIPISYNPRSLQEGKKIGWKDAVKGVVTLFQIKFFGR